MERNSLRALWLKERSTAAATMCTIPVLACVGTLAGFTDFISGRNECCSDKGMWLENFVLRNVVYCSRTP